MSDYDSQSIDIAFQEMKGLFEHTEARGRELLLKSQILLGVSGVLLTLWTNAVLRLFDEAPSGVITFLAVLGPLGLLTIGALYSIRSIMLGDHEVLDKAFLLEPATWQQSPDRVRVAMMKALAKSIETNETILFMRQRRYKKALRFVTAGLITIALSTVWLLYTETTQVWRGAFR